MRRTIVTSFLIFLFLLTGTTVAILYAKGYRFLPQKDSPTFIQGTGLLVLTSKPDGAKVFVNDELTTATNNTINLSPGEYSIRITQEGYISWKKNVVIQKEVVTQADALLVPAAPKLESITLTGAQNPVVDPTGTLLAYTVSSASAARNGIYLVDMSVNPLLNIGGSTRQLTDDSLDAFSQASLAFSPDGREILATVNSQFGPKSYLLTTNGGFQTPRNATTTLTQLQVQWQNERDKLYTETLRNQKRQVAQLIKAYFADPLFSPENDKALYTASQSAELPILIKPRLIGSNSTNEARSIKKGNLYVYDIKEDRNYLINEKSEQPQTPVYQWHPDSSHLLYIEDKKVKIVEYDAANNTTIYSGPFENNFIQVWPDGSRLVIITNLNSSDTPLNLYTISLK